MKLNWFSPLPPARTDIASYTERILPTLCKYAEVILWTDQKEIDQQIAKCAKIEKFSGLPDWTSINRADLTIYNMGNNYAFHGPLWHVSRKHRGMIILHDLCFHHFFETMYRSAHMDERGYVELMGETYGERGRADALKFLENPSGLIDSMAERYPLTEPIVEKALGILVHTPEAMQMLKKYGRWHLAWAHLPFPARRRSTNPKRDGPPFNLIVFGYLGRNRRLLQILEALSLLEEKHLFRLNIFGQVEEESIVRARIEELELGHLVSVRGFVDEEELDAALEGSHLAINLRYPTMGEVSGSQLRIWDHSLPTLVTRVGWYATIPETIVAHVDPQNEIAEIRNHLISFLQAPERFASMGERGRRLLEEAHQPEAYVQTLLELATEIIRGRARLSAIELAQRIGAELALLNDPKIINDCADRMADLIGDLFAEGSDRSTLNRQG